MSLISYTAITDGTTADAADVNTPLTTIYTDYNGNITDANIASGAAIAFSKVAGGSATALAAWASYTPTFTNVTLGNGSVAGKWVQVGKIVFFWAKLTLGSTTSIAAQPFVSVPVTTSSNYAFNHHLANVVMKDTSAGTLFQGAGLWDTTVRLGIWHLLTNSTYAAFETSSGSAPLPFASTDIISVDGYYEVD